MKLLKNIISAVFCLVLCMNFCPKTYAEQATATIKISHVTALPNESATVDIKISNNPGIMTMAFSIVYDNSVLEYETYSKGYLGRYQLADHSDLGYISFLSDESDDICEDGVILSVKFKVKSNAKPGRYAIRLENSNRAEFGESLKNSFSTSKLNHIVPNVINGSVTVGETCENAGHKYGEWKITEKADCKNTGKKQHSCLRCGYTETETVPITHDFETDWTVDRAATPETEGIMSRHCKNCDAVTDEIKFTYEEVESSQTPDNSSKNEITSDTKSDNSSDTQIKKTPIINIENEKNPLSAVENIKDYQQNIKPYVDNSDNSDDNSVTSDTQSENQNSTDEEHSDDKTENDNDDSDNNDNTHKKRNVIVFIIISITVLLISSAIVILFIIKRKKN